MGGQFAVVAAEGLDVGGAVLGAGAAASGCGLLALDLAEWVESPWIRRRLELLDSDQGLVGP
ncbi:hypothetical protein CQY20_32870 [Mycolicibacterium agri]|uniref:Uncharacterized protein n=1 Tax=Mycolicibacterium agri TaxID=36811 RepID=A0A2A7MNX4_MYCAG|nr:hypothetical protein CQY20_32870 [Mycolicibacterium agri]GFG55154.1 hypothetical protein MAGR_65950 [Mycolicibacterium agri]